MEQAKKEKFQEIPGTRIIDGVNYIDFGQCLTGSTPPSSYLYDFLEIYAKKLRETTGKYVVTLDGTIVYEDTLNSSMLKSSFKREYKEYIQRKYNYPLNNEIKPFVYEEKKEKDGFFNNVFAGFSLKTKPKKYKGDYWREFLAPSLSQFSKNNEHYGDVYSVIEDFKQLCSSDTWKFSDNLEEVFGVRNFKLLNDCTDNKNSLNKFFISYVCDDKNSIENSLRMIYVLSSCLNRTTQAKDIPGNIERDFGNKVFLHLKENGIKGVYSGEDGWAKISWTLLLSIKISALHRKQAPSNLYTSYLHSWLHLSNAFSPQLLNQVEETIKNVKPQIDFDGGYDSEMKNFMANNRLNYVNFINYAAPDNILVGEDKTNFLLDISQNTQVQCKDIKNFKNCSIVFIPQYELPWLNDSCEISFDLLDEYKSKTKDSNNLDLIKKMEKIQLKKTALISLINCMRENFVDCRFDYDVIGGDVLNSVVGEEFLHKKNDFFTKSHFSILIDKDRLNKHTIPLMVDAFKFIYEDVNKDIDDDLCDGFKRFTMENFVKKRFNEFGLDVLSRALTQKEMINDAMNQSACSKDVENTGFKL